MNGHDLARKYVDGPNTTGEAEQFIRDCVVVIGGGFHPDDNFADYAVSNGNAVDSPFFSTEDAMVLEEAMERAFKLVADPYNTALQAVRDTQETP